MGKRDGCDDRGGLSIGADFPWEGTLKMRLEELGGKSLPGGKESICDVLRQERAGCVGGIEGPSWQR